MATQALPIEELGRVPGVARKGPESGKRRELSGSMPTAKKLSTPREAAPSCTCPPRAHTLPSCEGRR